MPASHDVWVIHPKLAPVDDLFQSDREDLDELGLVPGDSAAAFIEACERYWGGAWPGEPLGGDTLLGRGDLDRYELVESPRSTSGAREFLLVPRALRRVDRAMLRISPRQAGT